MKNKFLIVSSVLVFSILGSRCGGADCSRTDCGNPVFPTFSFKLVSSAGKDLIGGSAKIYDTANVKVLGKLASTGSSEQIKRTFLVVADTNYHIGFTVSKNYSAYYVQLNNTITDSLFFSFTLKQTDCCDKSYFSFSKHNSLDITPPVQLPYGNYAIVK